MKRGCRFCRNNRLVTLLERGAGSSRKDVRRKRRVEERRGMEYGGNYVYIYIYICVCVCV